MNDVQKSIDYFKKKLQQGVSRCRRKSYETAISAMQELQQYRELKKKDRLLELPCAVGDTVYEVFYDELNNPQYYICKYEVEDISTKAIKYAGDWVDLVDLRNTYFNREEAEERLREMAGILGQSVLPIR